MATSRLKILELGISEDLLEFGYKLWIGFLQKIAPPNVLVGIASIDGIQVLIIPFKHTDVDLQFDARKFCIVSWSEYDANSVRFNVEEGKILFNLRDRIVVNPLDAASPFYPAEILRRDFFGTIAACAATDP